MNIKSIFHYLSYLQYPMLVFVIYFALKPYLNGFDDMGNKLDSILESINHMLMFIGLAISFATLQDTDKLSIKFEKQIWENPQKGKRFILVIAISTLLALTFGIIGYFIIDHKIVKELSIGAIVLGIGLLGFLKTAIEVFENHRKDKKTTVH